MTNLLDIHHHGSPQRNALNAILYPEELPSGDFLFSVGLHPWSTYNIKYDSLKFQQLFADPRVMAVGESGIDKNQGASIEKQTEIFRQQIEFACERSMPLIIHCVRSFNIVLPLLSETMKEYGRNELPVVIHGFRGKPELAQEILRNDFYISFGEKFNAETIKIVPSNRLLAETDESNLSIEEIIERISKARNCSYGELSRSISENIEKILLI